ncbi:MAG: DUF3299 domain-containing protein [Pirellulaceae bacterium]|nr:DUF3299 domain-containing protein [Pirellulaceae bacterium]
MTSVTKAYEAPEAEGFVPYRALCRTAVISLIFGLLSVAALLAPVMGVLPLFGLFFGGLAWWNIRRYPDELAGRGLAAAGIALSLLLLVSAIALHTYVYVTEVPEGYQRIAFRQLQPERGSPSPIPDAAFDLNGQQVFVKGYVHPGVASQGYIREFILVPDMGTCCFGGQPKLTDMMTVTLKDPLRITYSQRLRKLGGVLRVSNEVKPVAGGLNGGIYELEADYLR